MNAEQLQFPDKSFDVVSLNLILRAHEHPKQALVKAIRVMKQTRFPKKHFWAYKKIYDIQVV